MSRQAPIPGARHLTQGLRLRNAELGQLAGFLARGSLRRHTELQATFTESGIMASHRMLGGNFNLGRLRSRGDAFSDQEDISLVSVDRFIARFRESTT